MHFVLACCFYLIECFAMDDTSQDCVLVSWSRVAIISQFRRQTSIAEKLSRPGSAEACRQAYRSAVLEIKSYLGKSMVCAGQSVGPHQLHWHLAASCAFVLLKRLIRRV